MKVSCFATLLQVFVTTPNTRAAVENRTRPGELLIDPSTLINLGFEWMIEGDDNRSANVEVVPQARRDAVETSPASFRLQGQQIYQGQGVFDVVSPNMFAGSIFDLEPDTPYEVR